jgi:GNAT superfamily N-acetyltransferase
MIEIVKAEEKHVADIGNLWWEFIKFHQDIEPVYELNEDAISGFEQNHLRPFMKSEDKLVMVTLEKGRVVGYSMSEIRRIFPGLKREIYGYIDEMAVTDTHRRKGIGQKMFNEIIKWFRGKGIKRVELGTAAQNLIGNSFWQKQGFTICAHTLYKEI